jgi:hypothetical protein
MLVRGAETRAYFWEASGFFAWRENACVWCENAHGEGFVCVGFLDSVLF